MFAMIHTGRVNLRLHDLRLLPLILQEPRYSGHPGIHFVPKAVIPNDWCTAKYRTTEGRRAII